MGDGCGEVLGGGFGFFEVGGGFVAGEGLVGVEFVGCSFIKHDSELFRWVWLIKEPYIVSDPIQSRLPPIMKQSLFLLLLPTFIIHRF